jgi:DnaJ domain
MFERNKVDNRSDFNNSVTTVEILLDDGNSVLGRLYHPASRALGDELNSPSQFIDFEPFGQSRTWLTKRSIQTLKVEAVPRADQLERGQASITGPNALNPHAVLRVAADADKETIREAYHKLVRLYHPDRFASTELPPEVAEYLNAMARRVNLAYAALMGTKSTRTTAAA